MDTTIPMPLADDKNWLLPLATWFSPAYPVGGFSYSHGLEWSVEAGAVRDRQSLQDYAATALEAGGGWTDLVLLAASFRAAGEDDADALDDIFDRAGAIRSTAELWLETMQQGTAFVAATCAAWPGTPLDGLVRRRGKAIPYPVAVGAACAGSVPLDAALIGFGHGFAANLVSAGVRLIPLGQTDGQRALAGLASTIASVAQRAASTTLEELGTAAFGIEIASMRHETQYTRLFRS